MREFYIIFIIVFVINIIASQLTANSLVTIKNSQSTQYYIIIHSDTLRCYIYKFIGTSVYRQHGSTYRSEILSLQLVNICKIPLYVYSII